MLPLALAAAVAPQLYKGLMGLIQGNEADHLQVHDTTPPAFKEALALGRQGAAAELPGMGTQLNQVQAGVNDTLSAAAKAGTSSQSVLGLLSSADANRNKYLADLATRSDAFHQQKERELTGLLGQQAAYQQHDQDTFDKNRAALKEAGQRNLYGALDGASQVAAYGLRSQPSAASGEYGLNSELIKTAGNKVAAATGIEASGPDDIRSARRKAANPLGVPDYGTWPGA